MGVSFLLRVYFLIGMKKTRLRKKGKKLSRRLHYTSAALKTILPDAEAADPDEVGVIRPPPTAELKPIRDGLPLPGAKELCDGRRAAWDNCAREEPLRFKFCNEPIPKKEINFIYRSFQF